MPPRKLQGRLQPHQAPRTQCSRRRVATRIGRQQRAQAAEFAEQGLGSLEGFAAARRAKQQREHFGIGQLCAILRPSATAPADRGSGGWGWCGEVGFHGAEDPPGARGIASGKLQRIPP